MNELEIKKVPFMGADLMAARDKDGQIWAGVSYICNGIGLTKHQKDRQVTNIQTDKVLSQGCLKFEAGVFDPNNETVAVKLDFVPLWLAKISITPTMEAETPELAATLVEYQLKAKDVLAAAFLPEKYRGGYLAGQETMTPEELMAKALMVAHKTLADREARISGLTVDNQIMRPKAEYFDNLVERNTLTSFRETAKELGVKEKVLIGFLLEKKYIYRDKKGKLMPYANKNDGLFEVKECFNEKTKWSGTQTLVTPKGHETFRLLLQGM